MGNKKIISRRDALKRMSKAAIAVATVTMFPSVTALANSTDSGSQYVNSYVDKCYSDYSNYHNYTNYNDYSNYGNYRNYSNYRDYYNYRDYSNYNDAVE